MLTTNAYHIDLNTRLIDINQNIQAVEMYAMINKLWHHPMFRCIPFPFDPQAWAHGYLVAVGNWTIVTHKEWPYD